MDQSAVITEAHGNLLDADVDALVNTVNTVGVMGKGIALQFKRAYPDMFKDYSRAARRAELQLGRMHVWATGRLTGPRYVINFPTKGHWRADSKLADIELGLADLVRVIDELQIKSIAIPPLGCGNGGLDWVAVEPKIRQALAHASGVEVIIYPPGGAPAAASMKTATRRPNMTPARAALVHLLTQYEARTLDASLIEVQKLLYFLQEAGEQLRLKYVKARYGPYADNLRHTLSSLEGHFLIGFGDGSARVSEAEPIRVLEGAEELALTRLDSHEDTRERIQRVLDLVEGFETAYGMELLATVHWLANEESTYGSSPRELAELVKDWSPRKGQMFTEGHVAAAWTTLVERGWLDPADRV